MRDYVYSDENDVEMPVSEMATIDILECLVEGVKPLAGENPEAIRERLELELFIREKGLRECTH